MQTTDDTLRHILQLLTDGRLGLAISNLENYLLTYPQQTYMQQLASVSSDYRLMVDYWQKGYEDDMRQQVFQQLLCRVYELTANIAAYQVIQHSTFWKSIFQRPRNNKTDWSISAIRNNLEDFVSNQALLELEPDNIRQQKNNELYRDHEIAMRNLFDYVLTSRQWKENLANAFIDMLTSPTVDSADQQLLVSAITLSGMQQFSFQKFRVLLATYQQSNDEHVRQRALVGWVLTAHNQAATIYPAMRQMVADACADEHCRSELAELQMQLYYCMAAEADTATIQKEILPDMMNGSNIKITRKGLVELDEDSLDDILHPEAAEQNMERMEQSMHRMANMQKQGADIYFGGFSQMKRYPFFSDMSNWFVPFYGSHPAISHIWQRQRGQKFLQFITQMGAFCDSDKYSFVLAFDQVLERLPKSMLKMVEDGEATPTPIGGEAAEEEQRQPAFIRRMYLQNLYRFFRLFPARSEFLNPFAEIESSTVPASILFFANSLFCGTELEQQFVSVAAFLAKRQRSKEALCVLKNLSESMHTYHYYILMGSIMQHSADHTPAETATCFSKALQLQPDSERALSGYARALFKAQDYEHALQAYNTLLQHQPDNRNYQLGAAATMTSLGQAEEALKLLFKLHYDNPDDYQVRRMLAWALTVACRYEQAEKNYNWLIASEYSVPEDLLNYAYCLWFAGKNENAVSYFRKYVDSQHNTSFSLAHEFIHAEHQLIASHGITDIEVMLMLDSADN